ncbi:MAG: hypothetical protein ACT4OT_10985 [Acidobacteriota bacterium]
MLIRVRAVKKTIKIKPIDRDVITIDRNYEEPATDGHGSSQIQKKITPSAFASYLCHPVFISVAAL